MKTRLTIDVKSCETIADFRIIIRMFHENLLEMPRFKISEELYVAYKNNFNDMTVRDKGIELSETNEVELDGVQCIIEEEPKFLKCFIEGDQLCVVRADFVNLQESPAVFMPLDELRKSRLKDLK